jgi:hypothetical protein
MRQDTMFDPPVKTFRHEQFDGYKAGRADAPTDLHGQIDRIREIVDALGIPRFEVNGYEADDVIASNDEAAIQMLYGDRNGNVPDEHRPKSMKEKIYQLTYLGIK